MTEEFTRFMRAVGADPEAGAILELRSSLEKLMQLTAALTYLEPFAERRIVEISAMTVFPVYSAAGELLRNEAYILPKGVEWRGPGSVVIEVVESMPRIQVNDVDFQVSGVQR